MPQLVESQGTIVNAAGFDMTQSLRALLAAKSVRVHAMLAGPIDTDMVRGLEVPKATPQSVAEAIFDGLESGEEETFPDVISINLADTWRTSAAKEFEHQFAALVNPQPVAG